MKLYCALFFSIFSFSINAFAGYEFIGEVDGRAFYAVTESGKREGDIGEIYVNVGDRRTSWRFDCPKKSYIDPVGGLNSIQIGSIVYKAMEMACKRSWEVWK